MTSLEEAPVKTVSLTVTTRMAHLNFLSLSEALGKLIICLKGSLFRNS